MINEIRNRYLGIKSVHIKNNVFNLYTNTKEQSVIINQNRLILKYIIIL